ncbi:hypothetical protein [Novosphingobium aquae]|uniref:Uncharacterized protein n=1 Tax=Novosphingobium aquae TaxID=3133435 RepID=A0ABU8S9A0_9SPHN
MEQTGFLIKTFTMVADLNEDRIRLDVIDDGGALLSIHLTRRLTDRLVPDLSKRAEANVRSGLPKDLTLSFEQEALRIAREANPLPPVQIPKDAKPSLCQTIKIAGGKEAAALTLIDGSGFEAKMNLDRKLILAFLDVALVTYRSLEWSEESFPQWIRERGNRERRGALLLN